MGLPGGIDPTTQRTMSYDALSPSYVQLPWKGEQYNKNVTNTNKALAAPTFLSSKNVLQLSSASSRDAEARAEGQLD